MTDFSSETTISIVDYFNNGKETGVQTYIDSLTSFLTEQKAYKVNIILLNSPNEEKLQKDNLLYFFVKEVKGTPLATKRTIKHWGDRIIDLLKPESPNNNYIFHFNWVEHSNIALYLKTRLECLTVLTLHYILWKNSVTTNYNYFYNMHEAFPVFKH